MPLRDKSAASVSETSSDTPAQDFPHEEVCAQTSRVSKVWAYMKNLCEARLVELDSIQGRNAAYLDTYQTVWKGRQALERSSNVRGDSLVGEMLALLWQSDLTTLMLVRIALVRLSSFIMASLHSDPKRTAFQIEAGRIMHAPPARLRSSLQAHYVQELSAFIQRDCPQCLDSPEQRYQAVVAGLRAALRHNMEELRLSDELFTVDYLNDSLQICRSLRAFETHDVCCDLLITARKAILVEQDGPRIPPLENLRRELHTFLADMPPEQAPALWQRLSDQATSLDFWPVVNAIRSPAAVPYLLDALPNLGENGTALVIVALQNLSDMRAVPALRRIAQEKTSPSAPIAESALAHILRHSRSDAAQLLRPTDTQLADQTGAALLRPASSAPNAIRPEEMLRAEANPVRKPDNGSEAEV